MDAAPELTRWRPESVELQIAPGEEKRVDFVRLPWHREVKILNGDGAAAPLEVVPNEDRRKQR